MIKKIEAGDLACGKGPVLTYGPAVQNNLLDFIISNAEKNKIAFQRLAASRSTGTDTDAFAYSNAGVTSTVVCDCCAFSAPVATTKPSNINIFLRTVVFPKHLFSKQLLLCLRL